MGILVGYEINGYKIWNCEKRRYEVSRDVVFDQKDYWNSRPNRNDTQLLKDNVVKPIFFNTNLDNNDSSTAKNALSDLSKVNDTRYYSKIGSSNILAAAIPLWVSTLAITNTCKYVQSGIYCRSNKSCFLVPLQQQQFRQDWDIRISYNTGT